MEEKAAIIDDIIVLAKSAAVKADADLWFSLIFMDITDLRKLKKHLSQKLSPPKRKDG